MNGGIQIINSFPNSLFYMQPSIENIENISLKRKPRAVSTFLKKTFELLNVNSFNYLRRWKIMPASDGPPMVSDSLLPMKNSFPKLSSPNISNTATILRSWDRYLFSLIQLNMYNFHKIRENNSESYFHHECFDRDNKYIFF